jgi:cob(I)alamin adenosyltransferase
MTQPKRTKGDGRAEAKRLVDLVQREVDDGATSVEEIHKAIANLPLDILDRLDIFEETAKGARKVQEASIGAMYDVIRKVNDEVSKLAKEILTGRPAHKKEVHAHRR